MALSDSYACRAHLSQALDKLFAPNSSIPYPSHVYIHGNSNTGKSTILRSVLNKYHSQSILWFDCREIYSMNMFYQVFLSALAVQSVPSMKNFKMQIHPVIYCTCYLS